MALDCSESKGARTRYSTWGGGRRVTDPGTKRWHASIRAVPPHLQLQAAMGLRLIGLQPRRVPHRLGHTNAATRALGRRRAVPVGRV